MRQDLTEIVFILDRSGSMASCVEQAEAGMNSFIEEQKVGVGDVNFTLVEFNTFVKEVYSGPIKYAPKFYLRPSGGTALLDALGKTINSVGKRLSDLPESHRPSLVTVVILTDGEENSSQEFTNQKIRDMITHQNTVYNWQFTYLGANQDAFAVARSLAIKDGIANYSVNKLDKVHKATSDKLRRMRCASANRLTVDNNYTSCELDSMQ